MVTHVLHHVGSRGNTVLASLKWELWEEETKRVSTWKAVLLQPNLRSDIPSLLLDQPVWKQVTRSSSHSGREDYRGVKIPGYGSHWETFDRCLLHLSSSPSWFMTLPTCKTHSFFPPKEALGFSQPQSFFLYWTVVALQCCVSLWCTAKQISHTYTYIPSFLNFLPI